MMKIITRFPLLAVFGVFLVSSVVLAQVLPEEVILDVFEYDTASSTEEAIDTTLLDEQVSEITASSTEHSDTDVASTTETITNTDEAPSAPEVAEPMMNVDAIVPPVEEAIIAPAIEKKFRSAEDFDKPSECRSGSVKLFFRNIGECARYVTDKLAEENTRNPESPEFESNERGI